MKLWRVCYAIALSACTQGKRNIGSPLSEVRHLLESRWVDRDLYSEAEWSAVLTGLDGPGGLDEAEKLIRRLSDPHLAILGSSEATELAEDVEGKEDCPSVQWSGGQVVRLREFNYRTPSELRRVLDGIDRKRAVVLDLRGNPGGSLSAAIETCSFFLDEQAVIAMVADKAHRSQPLRLCVERRDEEAVFLNSSTPLLVWQDQHTASAAELLAAALHGNGRALLLGRRSCGKGSAQALHRLPGGHGMLVSVLRYFTPEGLEIDGRGVGPDRYLWLPGIPWSVHRLLIPTRAYLYGVSRISAPNPDWWARHQSSHRGRRASPDGPPRHWWRQRCSPNRHVEDRNTAPQAELIF